MVITLSRSHGRGAVKYRIDSIKISIFEIEQTHPLIPSQEGK